MKTFRIPQFVRALSSHPQRRKLVLLPQIAESAQVLEERKLLVGNIAITDLTVTTLAGTTVDKLVTNQSYYANVRWSVSGTPGVHDIGLRVNGTTNTYTATTWRAGDLNAYRVQFTARAGVNTIDGLLLKTASGDSNSADNTRSITRIAASPNLTISSVRLVDNNTVPVTAPRLGSQVYVELRGTVADLPAGTQWLLSATVGSERKEKIANQTSPGSFVDYIGPFTLNSTGSVTALGEADRLNVIAEVNESDNRATVQVNVTQPNRAPITSPIPAQQVTALESFYQPLNVTDPDGDALRVTQQSLPDGATIDVNGIRWTPRADQLGTFNYSFAVTDGQFTVAQSGQVTVLRPQVAPQFVNAPTSLVIEEPIRSRDGLLRHEELRLEVQPGYAGQQLRYEVIRGPQGLYTTASGFVDAPILTFRTNERSGDEVFDVEYAVRDAAQPHIYSTIVVSVSVLDHNEAPVVLLRDATVEANTSRVLDLSINDVDVPDQSGTMTVEVTRGGEFVSYDAELRELVARPTPTQAGTQHVVTVRVTDDLGAVTEASAFVTVPVFVPGIEIYDIVPQVTSENASYTLPVIAVDPADSSGTSLRFSLVSGAPGMTIDERTGWIRYQSTEEHGGETFPVTVRVTNGRTTAERSFDLTVNEVNSAPSLGEIANITAQLDEAVQLQAEGSDPDLPEQTLLYELIEGPEGAAIDPLTGAFDFTATQPGQWRTTIRVTDDDGLFAERSFLIFVGDQTPPTVETLRLVNSATGTTAVIVTFSEPMALGTVLNASRYSIRDPGRDGVAGTSDDVPLAVRRVAFDPVASLAYVEFKSPLKFNRMYQLRIEGVKDTHGNLLDGDRDGQGGDAFRVNFGRGTSLFWVDGNRDRVVATAKFGTLEVIQPVSSEGVGLTQIRLLQATPNRTTLTIGILRTPGVGDMQTRIATLSGVGPQIRTTIATGVSVDRISEPVLEAVFGL